jgi:hypothetical protein
MDSRARFEFFEKLYFHELESREQTNTRIQIPLALLVSIIGALGFMIQNFERDTKNWWAYCFIITCIISIILILISGYHCVRASWGHTYKMTSFSTEWKGYYDSCVNLYHDQEPNERSRLIESALEEAVLNKYIECASVNAGLNEKRSYQYYLCIAFFLGAVVFVSVTFFLYFFGSIDKSLHTKPTEIMIVAPTVKELSMAIRPPPPPPAPPPTRLVRDDRRPGTPPPPLQQPQRPHSHAK